MKLELSVSAFFPAYNEEKNLDRLIASIVPVLDRSVKDFEVILVDDGSKDKTAEVALALSQRDPRVKLVRHPQNKGYGAALLTGFASATKDLVFFSDADNQFDFNELPALLKRIEGVDVVSGIRKNRQDPLHRRMNAWLWRSLVNFLFKLNITDINCAFKVYRCEILKKIHMDRVSSQGACINTEILVRLRRADAKIAEMPVTHLPRTWGTPTGAKLSVILRAFRELWDLRKKLALEDARDITPAKLTS